MALSLVIFVLGGEGRFLYANADWQVRDAVLRDLTINSWPFEYAVGEERLTLRAPVGMFFVPALVGKATGAAGGDIALLVQNSLLLGTLLAIGAALLHGHRRWVVTATLLLFSGWDIVGVLMDSRAIPDHLEGWAGIQFSSHITQAFWVPQHALAGWVGALLFLLWKAGRISIGAFCSFIPLLALLSPLGAMGAIPFAAYAGWRVISRGAMRVSDLGAPVASCALAVPSLLYLASDGDSVGFTLTDVSMFTFLKFQLLESAPPLLLAALFVRTEPSETPTLLIIAACLFFMPFVQIGQSSDFMMRASITPLALLAVQVGRFLSRPGLDRKALLLAGIVLTIGAVTPAFEIVRSFRYLPSPRVQCSLATTWDRIVDLTVAKNSTYFANVDALPAPLRPSHPAVVYPNADPANCWPRPWKVPLNHGL